MKMVERKWVVVISLVAMVLILVIPVHAYDQKGEDTITGSFSGGSGVWSGQLRITNITEFATTTKIVSFVDHLQRGDGCGALPLDFDDDYAFTAGAATGTLHFTADLTGMTMWEFTDPKTITWEIDDFHLNGASGAQTLVITNGSTMLPDGCMYYNGMTTDPAPPTDHEWGVYSIGNVGNTPAQVTHVYGGVYVPPTPTPTPTATPTPVPGNVRSTFITKSATTWNTIHGSNIMLYDTYTGTWKNSTSDADGVLYIDTLPYTTINAYATFTIFENEYADASLTANADVNGGTFIILMYPISSPPPAGSVNLFVSTMDGDNNVLRDVTVSAIWDGYQHTGSSGTYGTVQWVVPNQTQVHLTATKIGYDGADEVINTGEGPSYSTILYLEQESVTPTPTPTTTYTVIPTVVVPAGAGYANAQGQNMLNWLAANGMGLVQLCFFVTILALLGVKFGK